jgi:hypothetical protein
MSFHATRRYIAKRVYNKIGGRFLITLKRYTLPRDLPCGLVSASKIQGLQTRHIDMSSIPCVNAEANPSRGTKVLGPTKCHQTSFAQVGDR